MTVQNLLFCTHTLCISYVTFLLVRSSVLSKQLLCFLHGQGQKSEQKPTTKNFVGFHNHSPPLTMITQTRPLYTQIIKWYGYKEILAHIKLSTLNNMGQVFTGWFHRSTFLMCKRRDLSATSRVSFHISIFPHAFMEMVCWSAHLLSRNRCRVRGCCRFPHLARRRDE